MDPLPHSALGAALDSLLMSVLSAWRQAAPQPLWLIDPDRMPLERYPTAAQAYLEAGGQWALVGSSFLAHTSLHSWCQAARKLSPLSLVLFPGSLLQLSPEADAILFLFLASGRNPHYLIGSHVEAAPLLYQWRIEVIPTTYLLVGTNPLRSVHYITHSLPLPPDKLELIQATALAGLYLGQQVLYVDAGSGASEPPPPSVIQALRQITSVPILVGGGVRDPETAASLWQAGATFVVVGTATEEKSFTRQDWEAFFALCPSS